MDLIKPTVWQELEQAIQETEETLRETNDLLSRYDILKEDIPHEGI